MIELSVAGNNRSTKVGRVGDEGVERLEVRGDGDRQNVPNHFYSVHHHRYYHRPNVGTAHHRHVIQKPRAAAGRSEVDEDRTRSRRFGADDNVHETDLDHCRTRRAFVDRSQRRFYASMSVSRSRFEGSAPR